MNTLVENPTYLGDSVYAYFDGNGIELRLDDHRKERAVCLEPEVLKALNDFWKHATSQPEPRTISSQAYSEKVERERADLMAKLAEFDRFAPLLEKLPEHVVPNTAICCNSLMIYRCDTHEKVMEVMTAPSAGRWEKYPNADVTINYVGEVDGVRVEIYNAAPPPSCRIEEVEEEVPAHTRKVRKLVCK